MKIKRLSFVPPYEAFKFLVKRGYPIKLFLDSASVNSKTGRYSVIAIGIKEELSIKNDLEGFNKLREFHRNLSKKFIVDFLPFGIYGYISYDANRYIENIESKQLDDIGLPDIYFFLPEITMIFDNLKGEFWVISFSEIPKISTEPLIFGEFSASIIGFNMTKKYFFESVEKIKNYISKGDTFQVNFSQRIDISFKGDYVALYDRLRKINPSPFSFFFDFGEYKAVSCSPERLIKREGKRVETRPIAGTRRRGSNKIEDQTLEQELFLSEKERAEHIMLVDLERNDLGRVCKYGTVEVDELMVKEKYSHVMHIVSNVKGIIKEGMDSIDLIKAVFPGGTITGAPKVRTMEIIAELEPTRRSLYTGSVGYIGFNDTMDLNIVIRTLLFRGKIGFLQVGAGIVWDSEPEKEYEETLHKGKALLKSLKIV
ncbi:Anthranilate synthase [Desulfurobacterium thermolithotrophum DSM 11699]|uniref:Anthranilate synthase n=1 Tax=Desulfurobacterium thermolithotrophum (strain DSM 11699 / BSA) TaxID=868864 RepID=F0S339_DESTD|nr:anthranilate synthase component I family protein [Desulfurobacterium thermolithotrophum]ADY73261.1 Anthranilate synthase [Desulfurobacterium thermolithotrophum DSM 11699]